MSGHDDDAADLQPTFAPGYKLGEQKTVEEYAELDKNDESLAKWKASLGITGTSSASATTGPKVTVLSLFLTSPSLPNGRTISMDLTSKAAIDSFAKNPITIKEGIEYNVGITFKVNHSIVSGLRFMQVVKRAGIKVDKSDEMLGSYGPHPQGEAYTKNFPSEESPSGMLARSGTYNVKSRIISDDGEIFAEFEWTFKLGKEWS